MTAIVVTAFFIGVLLGYRFRSVIYELKYRRDTEHINNQGRRKEDRNEGR